MDPQTFNFGLAVGLFGIYFLLDAINAYFTIKVVQMAPFHAASAGCTMHFFIALGVLSYVNNFWYIIPMMAGSWLGIYTLLSYRRYKNKNNEEEGQPPIF
jgi:hypothetical protein